MNEQCGDGEGRGSWDALALQQRLNAQVQAENERLRGVLRQIADPQQCPCTVEGIMDLAEEALK